MNALIEHLRVLDLSDNALEQLPSEFSLLALNSLSLAGNSLERLPACLLPTLLPLANLTDRSRRPPDEPAQHRSSLFDFGAVARQRVHQSKSVSLEASDLDYQQENANGSEKSQLCRSLHSLDLSRNKLRRLPQSLWLLPSLQTLRASHNKLEYLPTIPQDVRSISKCSYCLPSYILDVYIIFSYVLFFHFVSLCFPHAL